MPEAANSRLSTRISADVGGTFTDVAAFDQHSGALRLGKTLTTPTHLVEGIVTGVQKAGSGFSDAGLFLHGSTVAINTMLERSGARTALVTTRGFRDVYEIGRVNRPDAYNLFFKKHKPLIERALRFEVAERMTAAGEVLVPLTQAELTAVADQIESQDVEAIAIIFLHSYRNPAHEIAAKEYLETRFPRVFVTASHVLSNEYREYERTSTVAANAYIGPRVNSYLHELTAHLSDHKFRGQFLIVQSNGGLYGSTQARRECIRMLESGPAAGVIGAKALCDQLEIANAIAFDMGGTTAKAGVIRDGKPLMANSTMVGGYNSGLPIQIPMIDIREVGTGGGSLARVGPGGALRVGPESAGADPGPACYGRGGLEPTVTDANLQLGRLSVERFLGGDLRLDAGAATTALVDHVASPLSLGVEETAVGIIRIAASAMANIVRQITTERGLDTRDFTMIAFGGAGPLHATMVASELQIAKVIIPNAPGHFSAFGMLIADLRRDFVQTLLVPLATAPFDRFDEVFATMERGGREEIRGASAEDIPVEIRLGADMRYVGQEHAVYVDIPGDLFLEHNIEGIKKRFDEVHRECYGYDSPDQPAEIVSLRCAVVGILPKPELSAIERGGARPEQVADTGSRRVYFEDGSGFRETPTFARQQLKAGNRILGPALVEEYASTTVVRPGDELVVDGIGNLVITVGR
jgi:N-methylhydantoinase A